LPINSGLGRSDVRLAQSTPIPSCHLRADTVSRRTREQIRSFQIPVTADDFPRFLWEGEHINPQDMNKGFLRGELLIKVSIPSCLSFTRSRTHAERRTVDTSRYTYRTFCCPLWQSKHWRRGVRRPSKLANDDGSITRVCRRRRAFIWRLQP
jgi:hypothetical protein